MSYKGAIGLYFLPPKKTMNEENYANLLKSKFELHISVHKCQIFMHDKASCHRSKMVKKFLEEKRIQIVDRPRINPDLITIKNL